MTKSALNHDCRTGCAKVYLDPKLHAFDACFGGRIRMGDIDGAVERRGYILFLEWKSGATPENFAQVKLHKELTRNSPKHLSVFVQGNPETMEVFRIMKIERGKQGQWADCSLEELRFRFGRWFAWADAGGFSQAEARANG